MEKTTVSRNEMVTALMQIGHGDLTIYIDTGMRAAIAEPELLAHMIAWNEKKGEVRDSKVALPMLSLRGSPDAELYENAAAHLCKLDPKSLVKALRYSKGLSLGVVELVFQHKALRTGGREVTIKTQAKKVGPKFPLSIQAKGMLRGVVEKYLRARESSHKWWDATALQHREALKTLYALNHIRPNDRAQAVLFDRKYPKGSVFEVLGHLRNMVPMEAAGIILNHSIPFLIAAGAVGGFKGKPDLLLALIERMSGAELITNTKMLERAGVFESPVLKAAYEAGIRRMEKDKKAPILKAGQAAIALRAIGAEKVAAKLEQVQERQLDKKRGIEGDWLVLADRSGSMQSCLEIGCYIAAYLARQVKGKVHLVLFNHEPTYFDVTGKTLTEIQHEIRRYKAEGGTAIGCGLAYLAEKNLVVNGIAIVSDGGDGGGNCGPLFHQAYKKYVSKFGIEPTVYLYWVPGDQDRMSLYCRQENIQVEKFELDVNVDYNSIPNLAATMRTSRYSLVDEIMETSLLTFNDVFGRMLKEGVA